MTQLLGPCFEGAIARDFVMLDGLRDRQKTCIESRRALVLVRDFFPFLYDAHDRVAGLGLGLLIDNVEYLLQAGYVPFSLAMVLFKSLLEFSGVHRFGHLWQGSKNLLLGKIDIF